MANPSSDAPPAGGVFSAPIMSAADVNRAAIRIAHEIAERNRGLDRLVIIGLAKGGLWLKDMLIDAIEKHEGRRLPAGVLDVSMYRDDIGLRPVVPAMATDMPMIDGKIVVLVDDVLFTGRTIRAALDAINDHGRPQAVQLAVMVDRGHRELPIRPDYVGKNLPTSREERVTATSDGVTIIKGAA
jgi:pyrimidine operon attenuation protein / uracil phosphoribosyltransferase